MGSGKAFRMHGDRVLFIDGEALVIDKPAGLPVDRPRDGSLSLENHLESLKFGFKRWPVPVHRLDRDTSGCLLLSRNPKAHARFQQAFEQGAVEKRYLAVLAGVPDAEEGEIALALAKVSTREAGWRIVPDPAGKAARTAWRVLDAKDGRSLVGRDSDYLAGRMVDALWRALGLPMGVDGRAQLRGAEAERLMLAVAPMVEDAAALIMPALMVADMAAIERGE